MKYVGFFDTPNNAEEQRGYALPAAAKMGYISEVLQDLVQSVLIVSPSQTLSDQDFPPSEREIEPGLRLKLFATRGRRGKIFRILNVLRSRGDLLWYLLSATSKGEVILAYHSLAIQEVLLLAQAIRGFKLIVEVEEVYADVVNVPWWKRTGEQLLFQRADGYIFSTEALDDLLNHSRKPYAIVYGDYRRPEKNVRRPEGVTRVVYAGTLDPRKGGAAAAAAAAAYLDARFEVHILGFGTQEDIRAMRQLVREINTSSDARVYFHGAKSGQEYTDFLHSSHIGLAPQDPDAKFNTSSFPSKILSYMAHGLTVVSSRVPAVERTPLNDALVFYDNQGGESVAEAIRQAAESGVSERADKLAVMDTRFRAELQALLAKIKTEE